MRDFLPQPEITAQLLEGVEFHPMTERVPNLVQFSDEQQVMGLPERPALLGYTTFEANADGSIPGIVAVNRRFRANATIDDHHGVQLYNTQEALTASLRPKENGAPLVRALYACEINEEALDATPYTPMGWMRDAVRRDPKYPDGVRIHGLTIGATLRYQANRLRTPHNPQETEEGSAERAPRITVPPRRITVLTGKLVLMGTVPDSKPKSPAPESQE